MNDGANFDFAILDAIDDQIWGAHDNELTQATMLRRLCNLRKVFQQRDC
mgnify:CR=1 FL=1|jgi:hypothetical protein